MAKAEKLEKAALYKEVEARLAKGMNLTAALKELKESPSRWYFLKTQDKPKVVGGNAKSRGVKRRASPSKRIKVVDLPQQTQPTIPRLAMFVGSPTELVALMRSFS